MNEPYNLKYRDELLSDLAHKVALLGRDKQGHPLPLHCIEVVFIAGKDRYTFDLVGAVHAIAEDLYFDERGNWAEAQSVEVRTL